MQHLLAPRPNTGVATGIDIDGDGQIGGPGDAQSYGAFAGQRGLLLLSRLPFSPKNSKDHSQIRWANVPKTRSTDPPEIAKVQRLAYVAMLQTSITWRQHPISLLTFHASPPVFDGPEDRNGRRNADEIAYAADLIDQLPTPFVLLANTNLDPFDGEGHNEVMRQLLPIPSCKTRRLPAQAGKHLPTRGIAVRRSSTRWIGPIRGPEICGSIISYPLGTLPCTTAGFIGQPRIFLTPMEIRTDWSGRMSHFLDPIGPWG